MEFEIRSWSRGNYFSTLVFQSAFFSFFYGKQILNWKRRRRTCTCYWVFEKQADWYISSFLGVNSSKKGRNLLGFRETQRNSLTVIGSRECTSTRSLSQKLSQFRDKMWCSLFCTWQSFFQVFLVIASSLTIVRKHHQWTLHWQLSLNELGCCRFIDSLTMSWITYYFALKSVRLQGFSGDLICKLFAGNAIVPISINAAALKLCTIAVERSLSPVKLFHTTLRMSKESVAHVIVFVWILAVLSCIPDIKANTFNLSSLKYPCKHPWSLDEYIDKQVLYYLY